MIAPEDILTPAELAARLKVSKSWVFEQTRTRAAIRNEKPLPCIRLGKYLRFSWQAVSDWLLSNGNSGHMQANENIGQIRPIERSLNKKRPA